jgi:hypothetical protein
MTGVFESLASVNDTLSSARQCIHLEWPDLGSFHAVNV